MARYGSELNTMQALELLELPLLYCSADTVRRQYRSLAKKYHPDNSRTGDADRFEEIQKAYEYLSEFFAEEGSRDNPDFDTELGYGGTDDAFEGYDPAEGEERENDDRYEEPEDGWTRSFAREFRSDAENYAPPSKNLLQDVEAVQKALAARPIDYEGLLLRAEWLEHNLTDGSCDGAVLLKTLGDVQDVRGRVQKAEKAVDQIAGRICAVEEMVQQGEDLLLERKSLPTIGNMRYKASLTRRFHSTMKRAEDCLGKAEHDREKLSQIEAFCHETVMSRRLLKYVQDEQDHLDDVEEYYNDITRKGRTISFPAD